MEKYTFDINSFRNAGENFLQSLTSELAILQIPIHTLKCDHLCFRVSTDKEYIAYKENLVHHGILLTEAQVNGRAISTFRLHRPFQSAGKEVALIELPAPKPGISYEIGFEHAEFLISECFDTFSSKFPNLQFVKSGNQIINPELCLKISEGRQVKFHHLSLDRVIELEQAVIKDIIFDLDGTLIDSLEKIYEINRLVFSKILNREVCLQEAIEKFHPEFPKLFESFEVNCLVKRREAIDIWGAISAEFNYHLFDGFRETLCKLKQQGFRLHLWSARDEFSARKILKHHEIEGLFLTCSFSTSESSKPMAQNLCFDWSMAGKNQTLVVGDSPIDMLAAQNVGAIGAAALWGAPWRKGSLVGAGAELLFYNLSDFTSWVSLHMADQQLQL